MTATTSVEGFDPTTLARFELHSVGDDGVAAPDIAAAPWADSAPAASKVELALSAAEGLVWARIDPLPGGLVRTERSEEAVAGFRVVRRRLGAALAMVVQRERVLVNGAPALPLAVLAVKDSVLMAPGRHFFVTQRLKAFVGPPPAHALKKPCPFCHIPITEDTRIYLCPCGSAYHYETADSHHQVEESERLNCFSKIEKCQSCLRRLTLDEFLEWDPASM